MRVTAIIPRPELQDYWMELMAKEISQEIDQEILDSMYESRKINPQSWNQLWTAGTQT